MKTSVLEVHDMLSVFSIDEVEKRIGEVPGVESFTVNFAAGSATVRFDETRLEIADIKSAVRQRAFEPTAPPVDGSPGDDHGGHAAASVSPAAAVTPASSSTPIAPTSASATEPDNAASSAAPDPASDETPAAPAAAEGDSSKEPVALK